MGLLAVDKHHIGFILFTSLYQVTITMYVANMHDRASLPLEF